MVSASLPQNSRRGFPKVRRLSRRADFERVYRRGRRHFAPHLTVFYLDRDQGGPGKGLRVGFAVGKALGGAVERNRMKRRLREAVRLRGFQAAVSFDVVIHPKRTMREAGFGQLQEELARAFELIEKSLAKENKQR